MTSKSSPNNLFHKLLHATANLDTLVKDLNCTIEDLVETLTDTRTSELLRIKAQLASMQVKLLAIHYMPHAMATLVKLTWKPKNPKSHVAAPPIPSSTWPASPPETKSQPPTLTLDKQEEVADENLDPKEKQQQQMDEQEAWKRS